MMRLRKIRKGSTRKQLCWLVVGQITGEHASLMAREYAHLPPAVRVGLCVDMNGVSSVDRRGFELLCKMKADHVTFVETSNFLQTLIDQFCPTEKRWTTT